MNIEVHYGGYFGIVGNISDYIGGKVSLISDFDSDKMSWFELRYMLKELGLVRDYLVFHLPPDKPIQTGLVEVNCDRSVLEMMNYLSLENNIVLYIMISKNVREELLLDYCLEEPGNNVLNQKNNAKGKEVEVEKTGPVPTEEDDGDAVVSADEDSAESIDDDGGVDADYEYDEHEDDGDESDEGDDGEAATKQGHEGEEGHEGEATTRQGDEVVLGGNECDPKEGLESDYLNSDSLHTPLNFDDDNEALSSKFSIFNTVDFDYPTIEIGMEFESAQQFRSLMRAHAIKGSFDLHWGENEGQRIVVKCKAVGCKFRVYAVLNSTTFRFQIRTIISQHTCIRALHNTKVTSTWLSKKYLELFRADPKMNWKAFRDIVQRKVGVTIRKNCCYRTKKKALHEIQGKCFDQFKRIRQYANALMESNPGSVAVVKTKQITGDDNAVGFEWVFIAYAACLRGFVNGCRPIIGMDGCHLSSAAGGILLSVVARDGNNQMYPIAIAVVEVENKNTWSWFINILVDAVGVDKLLGVTFITDRQKGLVESLKLLVPCAEVRFCVRHLYANFKEKFKGLILKRLLWKAAASYSKIEHEAAMKEMQEINMDAFNYLQAIDKHLWSRSNFISRNRCDLICNNISEAFNKYIIDARDKPIITMLEMIRRQLMTRLQTKREQIVNYTGLICPKIKQKLDEISVKSRECTAYYAGQDNFEVKERGGHCCVNMVDRVCDCNEWVLTDIPCRHAMAAIRYLRGDPLDYTNECYSIAKYVSAYEGIIYPIPDSSHWKEQDVETQILPPRLRRQPGRPAKHRKKTADEIREKQVVSRVGQMLRCSQCKKTGHNKRRCTEGTGTSGRKTSNSQGNTLDLQASTSRRKKTKGQHSGASQEVVQQSRTSQASTTARREKHAGLPRRRTKAELIALWKKNQQN